MKYLTTFMIAFTIYVCIVSIIAGQCWWLLSTEPNWIIVRLMGCVVGGLALLRHSDD